MADMRFDVVLPYFTNIPKDVAVNTFHFQKLGDWDEAVAENICNGLVDFYNEAIAGNTLAKYLSCVIKRSSNACTIKGYDLGDAEPRPPRKVFNWTLGAATGSTTLPLEVACCASYQADRVAGQAQARRRGRLFIGPLDPSANNAGGTSSFPQPATAFVNRLNSGMVELQATFPPLGEAVWSVFSRKNDDMYNVTNGWVDNDFDTQRRRGPKASSRTTWNT